MKFNHRLKAIINRQAYRLAREIIKINEKSRQETLEGLIHLKEENDISNKAIELEAKRTLENAKRKAKEIIDNAVNERDEILKAAIESKEKADALLYKAELADKEIIENWKDSQNKFISTRKVSGDVSILSNDSEKLDHEISGQLKDSIKPIQITRQGAAIQ